MITKGVILAGGRGTRLAPATRVTNKHLLPIYDRPMIFYPIETLQKMGITDLLIICGEEHTGDFAKLLGTGKEWGVQCTFRVQEGSGGIADALSLAESFAGKDPLAVILGDNIFDGDFSDAAEHFVTGAQIFLASVPDPQRFGVAEVDANGTVLSLEEKPKEPKSSLAVTGLYFFESTVFRAIRNIVPSDRGELEITDVLKKYLSDGSLRATEVSGNWSDAGTHESFFAASALVRKISGFPDMADNFRRTSHIVSAVVVSPDDEPLEIVLQSLLFQKGNFTHSVHLVLDGGTPEHREKWKRFLEKFPEIFFHSYSETLGLSARYNFVLEAEESDFYWTMSPETVLGDPYCFSKLLQKTWDSRSAVFGGKVFELRGIERTEILASTGIIRGRGFSFYDRGIGESDRGQFDEASEPIGFPIFASLSRTKIIKKLGGFDEYFLEGKGDIDMALRLREAGYRARFAPDVRIFHPNYFSGPRSFWKHIRHFFQRDPEASLYGYEAQKKLIFKHLKKYRWQTRLLGKVRLGIQGIAVQIISWF
ncbi:MAG: sugar phosphate nucleotidyltransferase [Candidatus Peregrinibacteria bacterium]